MLQSNPQRLQEELFKFGSVVKQHQDNLICLKSQIKELHDSLVHMQVALDKNQSSSLIETKNDELPGIDKETVDQIMQHDSSAAGILCEMQVHKCLWSPSLSLIEDDVIGIVATLGQVDDENLSRLLSEYLGLDTMLAIVCKSYDGVKSLEAYDEEGCIMEDSGMHLFGFIQGKTLQDRFQVICLENLRSYPGSFVAEDPQRRLDIPNPKDPTGEIPDGFLGFAVNLIKLDVDLLYCFTANGCGIRETLFYNLFSRLQVYKTRSDMLNALSYITDGAISLDGGMIKSNGAFSLGRRRENLGVRFPRAIADVPVEVFEIKKQKKQKEWEIGSLKQDMQREKSMLDQAKHNFQQKKQELAKSLAERSSYLKQSTNGGAPAPLEDANPEVILLEENSAPLPNVHDTDVAISLDGGTIKCNGAFSSGRRREDVGVRFPKAIGDAPMDFFEIKKQMKLKEWENKRLKEDTQREKSMLDQANHNFQQKEELAKSLAERSSYINQCTNEGAPAPLKDASPEVIPLLEGISSPLSNVPNTDEGNSPSFNPIDYSSDFKTEELWPDREPLLAWAHEVARKKNMVLIIQRSCVSKRSQFGKVHLTCERYGNYRRGKNAKNQDPDAKRTKKSGCRFSLQVREEERNQWRLEVEYGFHNHELPPSLDGHAFVGRLTKKQFSKVKDLVASGQVYRYAKGPSMVGET